MRVVYSLVSNFGADGQRSRAAEADGYDAVFVSETANDPFLDALVAAQATERVEVGTSIVVAFARTPMVTAYSANQLQAASGGRFVLGLGSQIQPHIEKRFGMPWSRPAARMREYIEALRAIWRSWQEDTRLDFRGEFYQHTLMPPFFSPGPNDFGRPPILLAAVGERMTRVAAEAADGIICHAFTTERYVREVTAPAIDTARPAGRGDFRVQLPVFVVSATTDEAMAEAVLATRRQLAFYASTPAYLPVLELHGWGELHGRLNALSKAGRWDEMGELFTDELLHAFAVVGEPGAVADEIGRRFGGVVTDVGLYAPYAMDPLVARAIVSDLKARDRVTAP
ncbi:MAG TPA: TIGR03617 family F420-dependent LLM class oxidoreductase [Pseudonocardia sp.]|nr:TIGR03617 family F420-dependent LLM class oxidoreductase [Pseudonocardia sp.]